MKYKYVDYYFLSFIVLVIIGFWPSYFSKFLDGTADINNTLNVDPYGKTKGDPAMAKYNKTARKIANG